jgi:hypothetical protein
VEEARQHSAVTRLSLGWQLYLLASAAMLPPYALWAVKSGRMLGNPFAEMIALVVISLATGLLAFAIAQPTYRKAKAGTATINQARIAVVWPALVLFVLAVASYAFGD